MSACRNLTTATALAAGLLALPAAAQTPPPAATPEVVAEADAEVDPASVEALGKMGAYLRTLQAFELKADITADEVTQEGRRLQIGSTATYRVRRPNGFTIDLASDRKVRKLIYDGKQLTLYAPKVGYYAQAAAPATIRATLDELNDRYDIDIPLEDLFHWGEPGDRSDRLDRGFYVGPARLNGVETDQYAYSTGDLDWQIWIERGDKPVPRRIVIVSNFDPARPQFAADLSWNTRPAFQAADFTFTPPADAKTITFAKTAAAAQ